MASVFELVRDIPASQAAERLGLALRPRGSRSWACCPFHGEKTASLCFFPDGGWHCFGCHLGGDAVTFYQEYLHISDALEAAKQLAGDFGIDVPEYTPSERPAAPKPTVHNLKRELNRRRWEEWDKLCAVQNKCMAILKKYNTPCDAAWETKEFETAIVAMTYADRRLDWLWQASYIDLALEYMEGGGDANKRNTSA